MFFRPLLSSATPAPLVRACFLTACCLLFGATLQAQQELFRYSSSAFEDRPPTENLAPGEGPLDELSNWEIEISPELVLSSPERLLVELPSGDTVTAFRDQFETRIDGASWRGHIPEVGFSGSALQLTVRAGLVAGSLYTREGHYRIAPFGGGRHRLLLLEENEAVCAVRRPPEIGSPERLPPRSFEGAPRPELRVEQAAGATIDVVAFYTETAASRLGGDAAARTWVQGAVDYLNGVLSNSSVDATVRLVFVGPAPDLNVDDGDALLDEFTLNQEVEDKRAQFKADVAHLFVGQGARKLGWCGIAWLLTRGENAESFSPYAFGITTVGSGCSSAEEVFAHEVGHNMGANHDPGNAAISPQNAVATYAYGHSASGSRKDSIMVYGEYETVPYYSDPDVILGGRPLGIEGKRDNARALEGTVKMVANYGNFVSGGGGSGGGGNSGPAPPSNLTATPASGTSVDLMWTDDSDDETSFHVEARPSGGSYSQVAVLPAETTAATVSGLTAGLTYQFRVRAKGDQGFGPYSNTTTATLRDASVPAPGGVTVTPVSNSSVKIAWSGVPADVQVIVEMTSPDAPYGFVGSTDGAAGSLEVQSLEPETPYTFRVFSSGGGVDSDAVEASATTLGDNGPCRSGSRYLCLLDRFEVSLVWKKTVFPFEKGFGTAVPIPGSNKTGLFWFFNDANIELLLKMLDGRSLNDSFWHFYGALSDVEYWISIRDTSNGENRTYHNPPGENCGLNDTSAFVETQEGLRTLPLGTQAPFSTRARSEVSVIGIDSPAAPSPAEATTRSPTTCVPSDTRACLRDGRFAVEIDFVDPRDEARGRGRSLPSIQTSDTGFWWFFDSSNVELAVKVLDGRGINGRFWVFYGSLSDVEYWITVTDTETGESTIYANPNGSICGGVDVDAL